jgi:hypothetical protein
MEKRRREREREKKRKEVAARRARATGKVASVPPLARLCAGIGLGASDEIFATTRRKVNLGAIVEMILERAPK